ncbi:MAG TPA: DUF4389 domain-containing protein [Candidatus Nanopelagicaceae bacterium]|nr:DUF4389 domain-containing protein [Candidatus Nanopelagicaceae bacterium]
MSQQIETNIEVKFTDRNRATTFFRIFIMIPAAIFLSSFSGSWRDSAHHWHSTSALLVAPAFLAIVFRGKYPSYVYSFNRALMGLSVRVSAYFLLLVDVYPTIEANASIEVQYPEIAANRPLKRTLPLVKWFLAIPLYVVGCIYALYALALTVFAWFSILFTGVYPAWCAQPVAGIIAYWNRVIGYAFVLVTDEYPTFSF